MGDGDRSSTGSVLSARVVGRDDELRVLRAALDQAKSGRGGVAFIVGEAGIGKSRLAHVLAADAADLGLRILRGRAVPSPTPPAYRPVAEALCSAVRLDAGIDAPDLGPFRATLGRLIPEWRSAKDSVEDSVVALAEGVLRFLRAVGGAKGCLAVLEDLHWADPESLTILEYLADNLGTEPVLCLVTLRVEDPSAGLDLARALKARRVSEVLELSRLEEREVADMVRSCLDEPGVPSDVLAVATRAEGVPFLVEELLASAVASGALVQERGSWAVSRSVEPVVPLTFADSIRRRLAVLGEERRAVLLAAAVLGRRFDWDLLAAMTGCDERTVFAALHEAVTAQIVAVDTDGPAFRFRHALSRDAVLAELLPPERMALSRRALAAIEDRHPGLEGSWGELAAELAEGAGDRGRAASVLLEVGRRSLQNGALASAEAALDRARHLAAGHDPVVVDIEETLVDVLSLAGKRDLAAAVGASLLTRLGDDPGAGCRRGQTYLRLARAAVAATRWEEARAQLALARTEALMAGDEALSARILALEALTEVGDDDFEGAVVPAREALVTAERLELPEVACEALETLGRCQRPYDLEEARAAFSRAYAIADEHRLTVWRIRALHELGTIDLLSGEPLTRLHEARDLAVGAGALATAAVLDVQIAAGLMTMDDPEPALAVARRGA